MNKIAHNLPSISLYIFLGLLAYMPLHIFLSTWLGSSLGPLEPAKVLKDIVLAAGFALTIGISVTKPWFKELLKSKLVWLVVVYGLLNVVLALIRPTDEDAEILGLVYNTRFLLFFLYGLMLSRLFTMQQLRPKAIKVAIASAIFVAAFAVFQYTLLPNSALEHVGYSRENGVLPAFFIDDKPDLERVMSTLRDPNSLGSYLIIALPLFLMIFFATKQQATKRAMAGAAALGTLGLLFTFSRSALIGLILALGVFFVSSDTPMRRWAIKHRRIIALSCVGVFILLAGLFYSVRDTYYVQNVVFHADQSTVLEDPNQLRIRFWQESVMAIVLQPEGTGPGTAGLASIRNDKQGTVLNENYYLQIGTELGILGLALFMAILVVVAYKLYQRRQSMFAVALLAGFVGLGFTNLLVHIWSNEAVAYTWWGLAACMIGYMKTKESKGVKRAKSRITK